MAGEVDGESFFEPTNQMTRDGDSKGRMALEQKRRKSNWKVTGQKLQRVMTRHDKRAHDKRRQDPGRVLEERVTKTFKGRSR